MIAKNEYRANAALARFVLAVSLFAAFGFSSYQIGWNSAEKAGGIKQAGVAEKADSRNEAPPEYLGAPPVLLSQQTHESALTAVINYSDTGE